MITEVAAKNYRSLAAVTVEFDPVTVIAGPNGAGKSNLVDVLRFVRDALQIGLDAAIANRSKMSALRRWSTKGRLYDVEVSLTVRTEDRTGRYGFVLASKREGEYRIRREFLTPLAGPESFTGFEARDGQWVNPPQGIAPATQPAVLMLPLLAAMEPYKAIYDQLSGMGFYNILPSQLREPQKSANPYPLDENSSNFATVLKALKQGAPDAAAALERGLQAVS